MSDADDRRAEQLAAFDAELARSHISGDGAPGADDAELAADKACVKLLWQKDLWAEGDAVAGETILRGRYCLVRTLGSGGFGTVHLADDLKLGRQVALKVPHLRVLLNPALRERFVREARAAARLDHPNLVTVYELCEEEGDCFLVAAYCEGGDLRRWLGVRAAPVPCGDAARLVAALADAVAYMHGCGIYHRDIKPTNVLLPLTPANHPDLAAPRLTDFGLAKIFDSADEATLSGVQVGTPQYMAPEQAEGKPNESGPATDIHALGVLLYELLAGRPPFAGESRSDTLRLVATTAPVPPRQARPDLPAELEAICLKCLEKQPDRRYATAQELGDDLRRFLGRSNVAVVPPPGSAQQQPASQLRGNGWTRRAALAGCLLLAVLVAAGLWSRQPPPEVVEGAAAVQGHAPEPSAEQLERLVVHAKKIQAIATRWHQGEARLLWPALDELRPGPGEEDLRGFAWHYLHGCGLEHREVAGGHAGVQEVAVTRDGNSWFSVGADGVLKRWATATDRPEGTWDVYPKPTKFVGAFSLEGKWLAAFGAGEKDAKGQLLVWDTGGKRVVFQRDQARPVVALAIAPDGKKVAYACSVGKGVEIRLWETETNKDWALRIAEATEIYRLRFSRSGVALAVACSGKGASLIEFWNLKKLTKPQWQKKLPPGRVDLDFSPENVGELLASSDSEGRVNIWTLATGQSRSLMAVPGEFEADRIACWPNGGFLSVVLRSKTTNKSSIYSWRIHTKDQLLNTILPLPGRVSALAYVPHNRHLVIAEGDHLHSWIPDSAPTQRELYQQFKPIYSVAFSPDSQYSVTGSDDGHARKWSARLQIQVLRMHHKSLVSSVACSPNGQHIVSGGYDFKLKIWDAVPDPDAKANKAEGIRQGTWEGHTGYVTAVAYSPDGKLVASASQDMTVRLWDPKFEQGKLLATLAGHHDHVNALAFRPDGKVLATGGSDKTIRLWDVARREQVGVLTNNAAVRGLAFSPDGRTLAAGDDKGRVKLWRPDTGEVRAELAGHAPFQVRGVAYAPDGKTLATGGTDCRVRLWCGVTGQELFALPELPHEVTAVAFAPDGRQLAATTAASPTPDNPWGAGLVRLWRIVDD